MSDESEKGSPVEAALLDSRPASRSERFLHNIVENIPAMIFVKEAGELRFELFNRAGEQLLGFDRESMLGKNDYDLFPREQADFFTATDRAVLESGEVLDIPEEPIETSDGERILHTQKIPLLDAKGKPDYLLGISIDITERKRREEELEQSRQQLAAVNEELEAFCYSVAHDLRAPLRAIDGFSKAIVEDCADDLDEHGRTYLGYVRDSAQRMGQLIDDLLELSRVTRTDLNRERVDLSKLAPPIIAELRTAEPERQVNVVIDDELFARGDRQLLSVVLANLLGNAWKFTGNREEATIELGRHDEDDRTVFYVRDNGVGFEMAYVDKLFGTFQRLHAADEFPGTGVGLASVQRIIRRHGGSVWAEGALDAGATFYFTLDSETPSS